MNSDREFVKELGGLWSFLAPSETVGDVDAIFVFGGIDMLVPKWAAELWGQGVADRVLVTGNAGAFTRDHFQDAEADVFAEEMIKHGVPSRAIIRELTATNTGQNVSAGVPMLIESAGKMDLKLALVAKPFIMRRCILTFQKQFPDIDVIPSPPPYGMLKSIDRDRAEFALRLVAEIDRLDNYAVKGFIAPTEVPDAVREDAETIRLAYQ